MRAFWSVTLVLLSALSNSAHAARGAMTAAEGVQRTSELQIRNLLEPVLDKYCHDECKLMSVAATVDIATPEEVAPGFSDVDPKAYAALAPSSARIRLLMDDKIGPVSRTKLLELVQQYLDTLDYPVRIETQLAHFPQPIGSAARVAELRERVTKQFRVTLDDLFRQFCPDRCLLADLDVRTEVVNAEEAQYGGPGEFFEDNGVAIRVKNLSSTILMDESLTPEEQSNIIEMAKLRTNYLRNVELAGRSMKFPKPGQTEDGIMIAGRGRVGSRGLASTDEKSSLTSDSKSTSNQTTQNANNTTSENINKNSETASSTATNSNNETNSKQERFERFEKIERVENGDAVTAELQKFKIYGLVFACAILSLLIFLAMASFRQPGSTGSTIQRIVQQLASDPTSNSAPSTFNPGSTLGGSPNEERSALIQKRYEIERLIEELMGIFATQPKVAKQVFSRILTEEGVEVTAQYLHIFGESVVMDMLRDPSLQADMAELMEYYAKNPQEMTDDEKIDLLRRLHNRTVSGKLVVMGSRSSNLFDFLADMDGLQILELIRNESLTVKAIVMTQCDPQKRQAIYGQLEEASRMKLMNELSRIDYLPRDYIYNVANALKRKRRENPKLNTEALPGSDVLLTLLERSTADMARVVVKNLEMSNPESARNVKGKLVTLDTLRHLRDGQLLEVVLSLKHDELLQFLKGAPEDVRAGIYKKSPKDLVSELEEELTAVTNLSREAYQNVERKILNRMKIMANEGMINLVETNERMLADGKDRAAYIEAGPSEDAATKTTTSSIKKVGGW